MSNFKAIGAAWVKSREDGSTFISVGLKRNNGESVNFNLFVNKHKKSPNQPDYQASMEVGLADALELGDDSRSPNTSSDKVKDAGQQYKGNPVPAVKPQPVVVQQPELPVQETKTETVNTPKQTPF